MNARSWRATPSWWRSCAAKKFSHQNGEQISIWLSHDARLGVRNAAWRKYPIRRLVTGTRAGATDKFSAWYRRAPEAAMVSTQESGLRETRTSRLSERAGGRRSLGACRGDANKRHR